MEDNLNKIRTLAEHAYENLFVYFIKRNFDLKNIFLKVSKKKD